MGTTVALLGPYGLGNLGDAATQEAAIAGIKRNWPKAEIVGISLNPEDTKERYGIAATMIRGKVPRGASLMGSIRWMISEIGVWISGLWWIGKVTS